MAIPLCGLSLLLAATILAGAEAPRLSILLADEATVADSLRSPWWATDDHPGPVLLPPGSPPLPIPDPTGIFDLADWQRFLKHSQLNPHLTAVRLLGAPARRTLTPDGAVLVWDRVVLRDRRGAGFTAQVTVWTTGGFGCAWTYPPAPVLR